MHTRGNRVADAPNLDGSRRSFFIYFYYIYIGGIGGGYERVHGTNIARAVAGVLAAIQQHTATCCVAASCCFFDCLL